MLSLPPALMVLGLVLTSHGALGQGPLAQGPCHGALGPQSCRNWHVGLDHAHGGGTRVHGHANTPVSSGGLQGSAHGSHVFGGPNNGAQSVGGGLNYQHHSGIGGGVDVTHHRGHGNVVSGTVGGSTKLGPGTLSVYGGANTLPHSGKVQGGVGATYTVPLP